MKQGWFTFNGPQALFAIIVCLHLTGCLDPNVVRNGRTEFVVSAEDARSFTSAPDCCADFAHFTFEPMTVGKRLTPVIDPKRPAFQFKTGKSYFLAYQLPDTAVPLDLKVRAWFHGTAFFPSLLFLDKYFAEVRFLTSPDVHNVEPGFIERGHIEANTRIEVGDSAKYMVVLTTDADMRRAKYSQGESTAYVSGKVAGFVPGGAYANDFGPTGSLTIDLTPAK